MIICEPRLLACSPSLLCHLLCRAAAGLQKRWRRGDLDGRYKDFAFWAFRVVKRTCCRRDTDRHIGWEMPEQEMRGTVQYQMIRS
ncbi:hypothetical protein IQ07DRAFT_584505 [Pyrenochaeta sp. DS3sAY3a]|nr:hypothetical protein IQ07DRAFT_584505 [Pyrenochaeta sp. DS3sAY3a]